MGAARSGDTIYLNNIQHTYGYWGTRYLYRQQGRGEKMRTCVRMTIQKELLRWYIQRNPVWGTPYPTVLELGSA